MSMRYFREGMLESPRQLDEWFRAMLEPVLTHFPMLEKRGD